MAIAIREPQIPPADTPAVGGRSVTNGEAAGHSGLGNNLFAMLSIQDSMLQGFRTIFVIAELVTLVMAFMLTSTENRIAAIPLGMLGICVLGVWLMVVQSRSQAVAFIERLISWSEEGRFIQRPFSIFTEYQRSLSARKEFTVVFTNGERATFQRRSFWRNWVSLFNIPQWRNAGPADVWFAILFATAWAVILYNFFGTPLDFLGIFQTIFAQ